MHVSTAARSRRTNSGGPRLVSPTRFAAVVVAAALVAMIWAAAGSARNLGTRGESASNGTPAIVAAAKAATAKREHPSTAWHGPKSGPPLKHHMKIAFVAANLESANSDSWAIDAKVAVKAAGWSFFLINGRGTAQGWTAAFNQALSLGVNGIITDTSADSVQPELIEAQKKGVPVVGMNFVPQPGPNPKMHVFYNMSSGPQNQGAAMADYIISETNGTGRAMILYDPAYAIAVAKAQGMKHEFAKCSSCKLLAYQASPLTAVSTNMGPLFTSWYQQYGSGWYVMAITDGYFDFAVPPLSSAGVAATAVHLVGSGGTPSAYQRIRAGTFQVATAPDPAPEWGYQAVDEINRALNKVAPYTFVEPPFLVVNSNVDKYGGNAKLPEYSPPDGYRCHYLAIWKVKGAGCGGA